MAKPSTALYLISGQPPHQLSQDQEKGWVNKKLVSIVPKPDGKPAKPVMFSSPGAGAGKSDRKCRKVGHFNTKPSSTSH